MNLNGHVQSCHKGLVCGVSGVFEEVLLLIGEETHPGIFKAENSQAIEAR